MAGPEAAVAIVQAREPQESILLIRRSERHDDPWSGHWSFPGGWRHQEDPDLLHTALRELEEECGLRLGRDNMEAVLPHASARRTVGRFVLVAPFLFRVGAELPTVPDPREVVEAVWISQSILLDPARHSLQAVPGLPREMRLPAIELNGVPLWGFTYRVITDWLGLVPKQGPTEQAGFEVARLLLEFLLSHGLTLRHGWIDRALEQGSARQEAVKVATVSGVMPVTLVLAHFSAPGPHVSRLNLMEVRSDYVRVVGLGFEEYFIYVSG